MYNLTVLINMSISVITDCFLNVIDYFDQYVKNANCFDQFVHCFDQNDNFVVDWWTDTHVKMLVLLIVILQAVPPNSYVLCPIHKYFCLKGKKILAETITTFDKHLPKFNYYWFVRVFYYLLTVLLEYITSIFNCWQKLKTLVRDSDKKLFNSYLQPNWCILTHTSLTYYIMKKGICSQPVGMSQELSIFKHHRPPDGAYFQQVLM